MLDDLSKGMHATMLFANIGHPVIVVIMVQHRVSQSNYVGTLYNYIP